GYHHGALHMLRGQGGPEKEGAKQHHHQKGHHPPTLRHQSSTWSAPAVQEPGDLGHCSEGSVHEGRVERGCNEWNVKRFWFASGNISTRSLGRQRRRQWGLTWRAAPGAILPLAAAVLYSVFSPGNGRTVRLRRTWFNPFGCVSWPPEISAARLRVHFTANPFQISRVATEDGQGDDLRHLIGM